MTDETRDFELSCPANVAAADTVQLAHGGGGRAMAQLIETVIRPAFQDPELDKGHDGAVLTLEGPTAFTTDSYVVKPLVFAGGDIGTLAVNGTVNDLAMCGAQPLCLSVGLVLEEGLSIDVLTRVIASMREAALGAGVRLVTGDTKVVDRGKADGMFINTSGLGQVRAQSPIGPASITAGDVVIVSGDIGRHGMAVMTAREGFAFESEITSDCAPLAAPVLALLDAGVAVRCLRDVTRGGLASALVEIAETAGLAIRFEEAAVPIDPGVAAACELLGIDPIHVACEGRFVAFVAPDHAEAALNVLARFETTSRAATIGEVQTKPSGRVSCRGLLGVERIIDMLSGEQLPRIC